MFIITEPEATLNLPFYDQIGLSKLKTVRLITCNEFIVKAESVFNLKKGMDTLFTG
jgi:hypothetical protein